MAKPKTFPPTNGGDSAPQITPAATVATNRASSLPKWSIGDVSNTLFKDGNPTGTEIKVLNLWGGDPADLIAQANSATDLFEFAQWAIAQMQGDSGAGESHWEQFCEYRLGRRAVEALKGRAGR